MEKIEISVICTSFNYERYIGHALDSIINQKTNFPFEIIVVDDCSTDNSRELLQTYKKEKNPEHTWELVEGNGLDIKAKRSNTLLDTSKLQEYLTIQHMVNTTIQKTLFT